MLSLPSHVLAQACSLKYSTQQDVQCFSKTPDTPYCSNFKCVECPLIKPNTIKTKFATQAYCVGRYGNRRSFCGNYQCVECPTQVRTAYPGCQKTSPGTTDCVDFRCAECNNASKIAKPSSICSSKGGSKILCRQYKCVECRESNGQSSPTCQSLYSGSGKSFCNNGLCAECSDEGRSSYCKTKHGKDFCIQGKCRECPTASVKNNDKTCASKTFSGGVKNRPICKSYQCVECVIGSPQGIASPDCKTRNQQTPYCANHVCVECPSVLKKKGHGICAHHRGKKRFCKNYRCYECIDSQDCTSGSTCKNNQCVKNTQSCSSCENDAWCQSNTRRCGAGKKRCNPETGACVRCLTYEDCRTGETCDPNTNQCIRTNCPSHCSRDSDCTASGCGTRTVCIKNKCENPTPSSTCLPPNIIIMTDRSCSMKHDSTINTGIICGSGVSCRTAFGSLPFYYSPQGQLNAGCDNGTCLTTRWNAAMLSLRQIIRRYGGSSTRQYKDRKVRWASMFFDSSAQTLGRKQSSSGVKTLDKWGGLSDTPNTAFLLEEMQKHSPGGGTNYGNAFKHIKEHIVSVINTDSKAKERTTAVVFTTDGDPNDGCDDAESIVGEIYNLKRDGKPLKIRTYIVGFGSGLSRSGKDCLKRLAAVGRTVPKLCKSGGVDWSGFDGHS